MMKKVNVEFMPGCFDGFEGTQEELDELVQHIIGLAQSGELMEDSENIHELDDEEFEEKFGSGRPTLQ